MIEHNKHIVSKVRWETSFNEKDLAFSFQSEISRWCKLKMENELTRVFDEFCPPEQIWKINSLVLDLGQIDYADLHGSLSKEFSKALSVQLKELLFYSDKRKDNIEILNTGASKLALIKDYLLNGYMPWWYKSENDSVQQVVDELLKNNRLGIINLLRTVGKFHDVRRRIVWQLNDDSLTRIVEGLEPNSHKQIIEFKDKFIEIQGREKIVQSSSSDFSKEAWFWVFSHLLVDRGTLFNKVVFMKSMLTQMASRYNIKYGDLILLVEKVIQKVVINSNLQSDFITTLTIISNENLSERKKIEKENNTPTSYWNLLENYLLHKTAATNKLSSADVNDLIISLSQKNKSQFVKWLLHIKKDAKAWSELITIIDERAYASLLFSIAPLQSNNLLSTIKVSLKLLKNNKIPIKRTDLWSLSLDYLIDNKGDRINNKPYAEYLINVLAKKKKQSKTSLLVQFTNLNHWTNEKDSFSRDLYEGFVSLQKDEVITIDTTVLSQRINELLNKLDKNMLTDRKESILFYELLVRWIQTNPKELFDEIVKQKNNKGLQEFIRTYLKNQDAQLIIENLNTKPSSILIAIQEVLKDVEEERGLFQIAQLIEDKLMLIGFQAMLVNQNLSGIAFIKEVLEQVSRMMSKKQLGLLNGVISHLFASKKIAISQFSETAVADLKERFLAKRDRNLLIRTHSLISDKGSERKKIGHFLLNNFTDKDFTAARISDAEDLKLILDYFLDKGGALKSSLVADAMRKIIAILGRVQKEQITSELLELFWKCVLLYDEHKGNPQKFKLSFDKAVAFHFNRNLGIVRLDNKPNTNRIVQLKSGIEITPSKLQTIVSKSIKEAVFTIKEKQLSFELTECLPLALELNPTTIQNTLSKIPITDKRIKNLAVAIPFDEFCWLISANVGMKPFFAAMLSLKEIVGKAGSNQLLEKLLFDFWKHIYFTVQTKKMDKNGFSKLVQKSIFEIAKEKDVKAAYILEEIKRNKIPINTILKESLMKVHEVFSILPNQKKTTTTIQTNLEKCENNGLIEDLSTLLLINRQVPSWFSGTNKYAFETTLNELIAHHPIIFLKTFRYEIVSKENKEWISRRIDAEDLIKTIKSLQPNLSSQLDMLLKMYKAFNQLSMGNLSGSQLQAILLDKILGAWTTNYWQLLSPENIWNELMWEICTKRGVKSEQFLTIVQTRIERLPSGMKVTLNYLLEKNRPPVRITEEIVEDDMPEELFENKPKIIKEGITVKNAGMVLLSDYIKMLFERLGLLKENEFINKEVQLKAIHYLQYVITGFSSTEESFLTLNKVICGLHPSKPITKELEITKEEDELIYGLINAVISYWPEIGDTSVDGFRGNWLVRDGILTEQEDKWELVVDKKPYDVLIQKSPFAFSIIKYPWMEKAIHVTWPY